MAADDSIDTEVIHETDRRFEIFVPSPKARINLGASNLSTDDEGPFGYTGLSIQSDVHLFIDANKHTLFQTGQNYCGQVGGKWLQYSNSDMFLSCTSSTNISADKKVLIASGAGQGQITAMDHGQSIRVVGYNSLELHYRVDRIQTSIFEFFHGRRKHNPRSAAAKFGGVDEAYFGSDSTTELAGEGFKGGFMVNTAESLRELLPPGTERADVANVQPWGDVTDDGDPIDWLDPLVLAKLTPSSKDPAPLEYGASPYFKRFDPYALIDRSSISNPWGKALAGFKNFISKMRRFNDVVYKYALLITDNFLIKRVIKAMEVVDHLAKASMAGFRLAKNVFGFWLKDANTGAGANDGRDLPLLGRFADEALSGVGARFGGDTPDGADARAATKGGKAKISSKVGPFDLSANDASSWTLTVEAKYFDGDAGGTGGKITTTKTLAELANDAAAGAKASLDVTASTEVATPGLLVKLTSGLPAADVSAWASELLGVPVDAATAAAGSGHLVWPAHALVDGWIGDPTTLGAQTHDFGDADTPDVRRFDAVVSLTRSDRTRSVQVYADGATVTVDFNSANLTFGQAAPAGPNSVHAILSSALGGAVSVGALSGTTVTLETGREGSDARITVLDGDAPALAALGLSLGQEETGTDPTSAVLPDLSSVTAEQLQGYLGSLGGVTPSVDSNKLVLESTWDATIDHDSKVTVSGNLADAVFSTKTNTEALTDAEKARATMRQGQSSYTTLLSWNHELQKLPEDTQNLLRPVRDAISDATSVLSSLESAAESATAIASDKLTGLPGAPEAIGLIAQEGITLGTNDRIVGAGGKGVIFIADGGTGTENHERFIPKQIENFVNVALAFDPIDNLIAEDDPPANLKKPPSLGFRVYSDSAADLYGTHSAQLLAVGRGEVAAASLLDGETKVGIGIARVAGSHAVEVVGNRHVVVSARNAGGDTGKDGGRVDVLGQTIFVGGFKDGTLEDFRDDKTGLGLRPLELTSVAGSEHFDADTKDNLKAQVKSLGWPLELRKGHTNTNYVRIHAKQESTMVVGAFQLHFDANKGLALGTRKAKQLDPSKNELDDTKAHLVIDKDKIQLIQAADAAMLHIESSKVQLQQADGGSTLMLEANTATLQSKDDAAVVKLDGNNVTVEDGNANGIWVKNGALDMYGATVKINGSKVQIL